MNTGNASGGRPGPTTTPFEEICLVIFGAGALTVLLGSAGVFWLQGATWLVAHHVLVPAAAHPMLTVPRAGGAGLDLPRAAIAAGVLGAVVAIAGSAARRAFTTRQDVS